MASYTLSPIGGAGSQFFDNSGNVLTGGKLYTYAAGTTTPQTTWTTPAGTTANSNPIVFNSAGRPANEIWLSWAYSYKFVLKDSNDVLIATYDNIPGLPQPAIVNDASSISYEPNILVTAGSFVVGQTYMIASLGTTDFTAIGAGYNSTGIIFTASGAGTGTGTAYVSTTVETRLRAYEADGGSDYIGFLQAGAGAITTQTVQDKLRQTVSVKDFGAVGDGVTDDTNAVQSALDAVAAMNGGTVYIPNGMKILIDSADLLIPTNVSLVGPVESPGMPIPFTTEHFKALTGVIILNPSYSIYLAKTGSSASISNLYIVNKNNYTFPTSSVEAAAIVAAFSGTAIKVGSGVNNTGFDCYAGHLMILGFNQAIYGNYCARYTFEFIRGDNTNGIYTTNVYDVGRIRHCHFWDFYTVNYVALSNRSGVAFYYDTGNDWSVGLDLFCYGYNIGFKVNAHNVRLINCGADGYPLINQNASKGFYITGNSIDTALIGCQAASHATNYYIESTNTTQIHNFASWGPGTSAPTGVQRHLYCNNGNVIINGGNIFNTAANKAVLIDSLINSYNIDNLVFRSCGTAFDIDSAAATKGNIGANIAYIDTAPGYVATNRYVINNTINTTTQYNVFGGGQGKQVIYSYARGNASAPTILNSNDTLFQHNAFGYDGSAFYKAGAVRIQADGSVSSGSMPGTFIVSTTPTGTTSSVDRNETDNAGNFKPLSDNAYRLGDLSYRWAAVYATNGTIQTSDGREKNNVKDSILGLNFINTLRPVSYKWIEGGNKVIRQIYLDKDGNEIPEGQQIPDDATPGRIITESVQGTRTHWGLIAQEVKAAVDAAGVDFGGWVLTNKDNPDSQQALRYDQFIAPLIKAVQELSTRVAELEAK